VVVRRKFPVTQDCTLSDGSKLVVRSELQMIWKDAKFAYFELVPLK